MHTRLATVPAPRCKTRACADSNRLERVCYTGCNENLGRGTKGQWNAQVGIVCTSGPRLVCAAGYLTRTA